MALNTLNCVRGQVELHSTSHFYGLSDVDNLEHMNCATKFDITREIQRPRTNVNRKILTNGCLIGHQFHSNINFFGFSETHPATIDLPISDLYTRIEHTHPVIIVTEGAEIWVLDAEKDDEGGVEGR